MRWNWFPSGKKGQKVVDVPLYLMWELFKGRNWVVSENLEFSVNRIKLSFISFVISWVRTFDVGGSSFISLLLCIL